MKKLINSPWGTPDDWYFINENAQMLGTPSHGGIVALKSYINRLIMVWESMEGKNFTALRKFVESHTWNTSYIYFEEDCDWVIFCKLAGIMEIGFGAPVSKEDVDGVLKRWNIDIYQQFTNDYEPYVYKTYNGYYFKFEGNHDDGFKVSAYSTEDDTYIGTYEGECNFISDFVETYYRSDKDTFIYIFSKKQGVTN